MPKLKTKRQYSAGGVVFRKESEETLWLVVKTKRNQLWRLPKGNIGTNESSFEAAQREVRGEAGLEGEVLGKVGHMKYAFVQGRKKYVKDVVFYLIEYTQEAQNYLDGTVEEIDWLKLEEAKERLTYEKEKEILEKANNQLNLTLGEVA